MKQTSSEKHFLSLAGEYGVCSELAKREIRASITYGNQKSADIIITRDKKAYVVEVKTSKTKRIVTGFFQKYHTPETPHPDFWVIVHINPDTLSSDFYVLTHEEMAKEQMIRNNMTTWEHINGVDNIMLSQLEEYKNKWETIAIPCKEINF